MMPAGKNCVYASLHVPGDKIEEGIRRLSKAFAALKASPLNHDASAVPLV